MTAVTAQSEERGRIEQKTERNWYSGPRLLADGHLTLGPCEC